MSTSLEASIDLYDHEIMAINRVCNDLNAVKDKPTTVEGWRNQIIGRFHEAGFVVGVTLRMMEAFEYSDGTVETVEDGQVYTTITINGRVEPVGEFDHDQQRAEVQADILGRRGGDDRRNVKVAMPGAAAQRASGLWVPTDT